ITAAITNTGAWHALRSILDGIAGAFWTVVHAAQAVVDTVGHVRNAIANVPVLGGAFHFAGLPGFQEGGVVPGPLGMPLLAMVHGGETVIPAGRSVGDVHYHISVNVPVGASSADIGREIVQHIQQYERRGSKDWRGA